MWRYPARHVTGVQLISTWSTVDVLLRWVHKDWQVSISASAISLFLGVSSGDPLGLQLLLSFMFQKHPGHVARSELIPNSVKVST